MQNLQHKKSRPLLDGFSMKKHLNLKKVRDLTSYQKLAIGSWRSAKDPSIYGRHDIDYTQAAAFTDRFRKEKGLKITPTYITAQAASLVYACHPALNTVLRYGILYQREKISFSFLTAVDTKNPFGKLNLSACVVRDITNLSLEALYKDLSQKIRRAKENKDEVSAAQNRLISKIPSPLMSLFLDLSSFLMYTLNIRLKGVPEDPFGSVMISNLGQIGMDSVFIPVVPYSKVPVFIAMGLVRPRVLAEGRRPVVRDMLRLNYTIDHRCIEGKSLSVMQQMLFMIFKNPDRWLPPAPCDIKEEFKREFRKEFEKKQGLDKA